MHKCVHQGEKFFNKKSELADDEKYEDIKEWTTKLKVRDYKVMVVTSGVSDVSDN
jgi:hypothetical protein